MIKIHKNNKNQWRIKNRDEWKHFYKYSLIRNSDAASNKKDHLLASFIASQTSNISIYMSYDFVVLNEKKKYVLNYLSKRWAQAEDFTIFSVGVPKVHQLEGKIPRKNRKMTKARWKFRKL